MNAREQTPSPTDERKRRAAEWFAQLRDGLCAAFEAIENEYTGAPDLIHIHVPQQRIQ